MGEVYVGFFLVVMGKNNKGLVYPQKFFTHPHVDDPNPGFT